MIRKLAAAIGAMALCAGLVISPADSASAQSKKLIIGVPGIPPIFSAVLVYVAEREGLFKKYGADVEVKPFDTGTAAARAVTAGDIDVAISPSPLIVNQISNASVGLIAIYGFPKPDWVLASTDATKASCNDVTGQPVGVDAAGAARSIALKQMLIGCGSKIGDVQQVALSSNTAPAMIAGRLTFGVLHLDDIAAIEAQGKKVTIIVSMQKTNPNDHYLLAVAQIDQIKQNRDAYVRMVAGLIAAIGLASTAFAAAPPGLDEQLRDVFAERV